MGMLIFLLDHELQLGSRWYAGPKNNAHSITALLWPDGPTGIELNGHIKPNLLMRKGAK
jgi:hypothetical protein